jgi:signal transduction histidine kinase
VNDSGKLRDDVIVGLRAKAHELSNSLETILQAAYLLGEAQLEDKPKRWARMIDSAAREAARINREIREILRS